MWAFSFAQRITCSYGTDVGSGSACAAVALVLASLVPSPRSLRLRHRRLLRRRGPRTALFPTRKAVVPVVDEARLPPAAAVVHRERSLWEVHRQTIVVMGVALVGQFLLIGALLVQRRQRRQSEGRNRALLRAMPDLMFLQTTDGVYLDCHASDPARLLLRPEQFLGRNMRDVLPPELLRAIEPAFAQAAGATEPVVVEYDLNMPDGVRRYEARLLSQDGRILTLVRDITERQRAVDALLESQERYALATAAGAVGVWDWNFETNELFVDARLKSILGFEDREISNRPDDWGSRVHPQDVPAAAAAIQACVDRVSDTYEVEHRMLHKDGSVKWLLSRGSAIRAADGRMLRMVGNQGGYHRTEAGRRGDSRKRGGAASQPSRDPRSGRTADRVTGGRAGAHRARPARRLQPADCRAVDRAQRPQPPAPRAARRRRSARRCLVAAAAHGRTGGQHSAISRTTCIPACCSMPASWPRSPGTARTSSTSRPWR